MRMTCPEVPLPGTRRLARVLGATLLALALLHGPTPAFGQSAFVNYEGKQTSPLRLSPDGTRLFAVNTPDARVSVFDTSNPGNPILMAEIPVGLEPVSVHPRNNDEAWVVSEVSDSVQVISVSRRLVLDSIHVQDEPADVVFANGRAFVSAAGRNWITVLDLATHEVVTNITLRGENPRAMVVNADGTRLYAAFALSGNRTTIVPADLAPPQPPPSNPNLPPPPRVALIVDAADPNWSGAPNKPIRYTMPDHDVVEIDTTSLQVLRYFSRVGTVNLGLALQPNSSFLWVANTDARNRVHFEPSLRGNFASNRVSRINLNDGTITHFDLNPGFTYAGFPNLTELSNSLAQPTAMAFGPNGNNFFLAAFGSDRVARVSSNGQILNRIELNPDSAGAGASPRTMRGPRGLALLGGNAVYVLNRVANTISVIDPKTHQVIREMAVGSYDPTPSVVREGRGFLYSAKLSGNGTVSCATCHVDAEVDMLAWDLGDPGGEMQVVQTVLFPGAPPRTSNFHPMKGPMVTQTLRGLDGLDPLHWRGDRTNFLHFNGAFDTLLGGSLLPQGDMQAYRDFINTIQFQPNPNQNLDRSFPTAFPTRNGPGNAAEGRRVYIEDSYTLQLQCNTCHLLPTGSANVIIPAAALEESQDFKVPHLRNVFKKLNVNFAPGAESIGGYGIIHDGIDPDLFTFLSRDVFGTFATDTVRKRNLDAFVQCFDTGTAPAVGYQRTMTMENLEAAPASADWSLLENQAALLTNIQLVVRGTVDGQVRGLLYVPATQLYHSDKSGIGPFTRSQLQDKVRAGDTLTLAGVPPGAGYRMAVDRNDDGTLDGDQALPRLEIVLSPDGAVVSWPAEASGFVLERSAPHLAGPWLPDTQERGRVGATLTITNVYNGTNAFFRLRSL